MGARTSMLHSLFAAPLLITVAAAQPQTEPFLETSARQAILVDGETGAILFEKDADTAFPPASLAKLMTMELVFQALADGTVTPQTAYTVSEYAWRTGGAPSRTSTMFAELRSQIPIEALAQGVVVQAANDAAIVLAEGLEGTEGAFAIAMNARSAELGLASSRFVNATGLPAEGQAVTVRDLAILARHIEASYPDRYGLYAQLEFEWNGILQRNRNPLLGLDIGATGMAIGGTEESGYALVGVAERDGRTTVLAMSGLETAEERAAEGRRLLDVALEAFELRTVFTAGETVGTVEVYGGVARTVPVSVDADLVAYIRADQPEATSAEIVYDGPLHAPVAAGDRVGRIEIRLDGRTSLSRDVFAAGDVPESAFAERALGAVRELAFGWVRAL